MPYYIFSYISPALVLPSLISVHGIINLNLNPNYNIRLWKSNSQLQYDNEYFDKGKALITRLESDLAYI